MEMILKPCTSIYTKCFVKMQNYQLYVIQQEAKGLKADRESNLNAISVITL